MENLASLACRSALAEAERSNPAHVPKRWFGGRPLPFDANLDDDAKILDRADKVAILDDGGFAMQLGEVSTAVRLGLPLKILVIENGMLIQIAWKQMMFLGNPQFGCELQPIDFTRAAEAMVGVGFAVADAAELDHVLDRAFATEGPVVIEATVDAAEPMLPPDYPDNLLKALPETPGHEEIAASLGEEPARTMFDGE